MVSPGGPEKTTGSMAHLLPFGTGGEKGNGGLIDAAASSDDGGVVDELVCSRLEEEQGRDEGRHIVGNDLCIVHHGRLSCFPGYNIITRQHQRKPQEGRLTMSRDTCQPRPLAVGAKDDLDIGGCIYPDELAGPFLLLAYGSR